MLLLTCSLTYLYYSNKNYVHITQPYAKYAQLWRFVRQRRKTSSGIWSRGYWRIFRKYGIRTAMKPYKRLRNLLVHSQGQTYGRPGMSVSTRFRATTVAVRTLEKQAGVMERGKKNTGKKWNPSATERSHEQIGKMWQEGPISQP